MKQNNNLKDRMVGLMRTVQQIEKRKFKKRRYPKRTSGQNQVKPPLHHRDPEREEREKGPEKLFEEILAENFTNLKKETDIQVQEAQRVGIKLNPKRVTPRHNIMSKSSR